MDSSRSYRNSHKYSSNVTGQDSAHEVIECLQVYPVLGTLISLFHSRVISFTLGADTIFNTALIHPLSLLNKYLHPLEPIRRILVNCVSVVSSPFR